MPTGSLVIWIPRGLAVGLTLFLALFALDEVGGGKSLGQTMMGVLVHLWPAALVLVILVLSWRRQLIGALAFVTLAAVYAIAARSRIDWVLTISGPLFAIGLLYAWAWQSTRATPHLP